MKKIIIICFCFFVLNNISFSKKVKPHKQTLVWADEFNINGQPDTSKWTYEIGRGPRNDGWGNWELQYYTDRKENVIVQDGLLKITAQKEKYNNFDYTSTRLVSNHKFTFTYGTVEAKIKLPTGVGTWPAFWLLGANYPQVEWPKCGEIDIMEHIGKNQNKIYGTLHYPERFGDNGNGKTVITPNVSNEFHIYKLNWTPKTIEIFVDDKMFFQFNNDKKFPFNHPFYILLNFAIGGNFAGNIDPNFEKGTMEVDYVRVYQ